MRPMLATLIAALALAAPVGAQPVADHLACYKIKDPQAKATYTDNVAGLVVANGCMIRVPAATVCVPASKTNVTPPWPAALVRSSDDGRRRC